MFEKLPLPNSITGKNYVAIEKIGEGSTGAVYRGYNINDTEQQHPLAIRFPTIIDTPKKRKDLIKKQAEVLQELASPHTIKYLDHCEHSINPYLVMGYVPETITYRIEKNTLTQKLFLQYLAQIPIILDFLRNKNKVHGDLKCGNLGIDQNKIIMLDFESTNEPGKYKLPPENTPIYYPPEFRLYGKLTLQSDTYTAGRNLEYMLTAQNAHSPEETFEEIELFYDMTLPDSFKKVYLTMTNPNPALRPSPSQLTTIIQPLIDDIQIQNLFHPMQLINITLPEWF